MNVLGVADLSSATNLNESLTTVHGITPNADSTTPPVTINLNNTVEEFLSSRPALFNPSLLSTRAKELGGLDNGNILELVHIHNHVLDEVGAGAEIGIENDEEVAFGLGECIPQVTCLLQVGLVVASDVVESIAFGKALHRVKTAIIEDPHLEIAVCKLLHMLIGVLQDFQRLMTARKVDVNKGKLVRGIGMLLE